MTQPMVPLTETMHCKSIVIRWRSL